MRVLFREIESYCISVFKLVESVDANRNAVPARGHSVQVGNVSQNFDYLDLDHPFAFILLVYHNVLGSNSQSKFLAALNRRGIWRLENDVPLREIRCFQPDVLPITACRSEFSGSSFSENP